MKLARTLRLLFLTALLALGLAGPARADTITEVGAASGTEIRVRVTGDCSYLSPYESVSVVGTTVSIEALVMCGLVAPGVPLPSYDHTVIVGPLSPGSYTINYYVGHTGDAIDPNVPRLLEDTAVFALSGAVPVPALEALGLFILTILLLTAGVWVLDRR